MSIRVQCPGCKTTLAVKDHLAGKRVKCPKCQNPLSVPGAAAAAIPVAAPPLKPAAKPAGKPPVKAPKVPIGQPADMEAEAAAALRDEPAATPPPSGVNGANGNGHAANGQEAAKAPIKFACEYCEAEIEVDASLGGKKAPCPECRRIIKVPAPKEDPKGPTDWRKIKNVGPSLAAVNQPAKVENAWGNERKSQVSDKALLEAGVIQKPKAPPIGPWGWAGRAIKAALLVLVVGGVGTVVWNLKRTSDGVRNLDRLGKDADPKWPKILQAEYHVLLADIALKQPKLRERAREHYIQAWQLAGDSNDPADKVDRDCFLIRLAQTQLKLGGEEMEIRDQSRFDWNHEVYEEIKRTFDRIDNPDARVSALREILPAFADKKQPELGASLVVNVSTTTPQAKAFQLALQVEADAKKLPAKPAKGKSPDAIVRCGYAEGLARKGDFNEALAIAELPGETAHRVQALVAIASSLALDPKKIDNAKSACESARKWLDKDKDATVPPWTLLQLVRLTARTGDAEQAKAVATRLPPHYQRRAKLEIALAALDQPTATAATIDELDDKVGPSRGLAWLALAESKARMRQPFAFDSANPDDDALRPIFDVLAGTR